MRVSPSSGPTSNTGWAPMSSGGNCSSFFFASGSSVTLGAGLTVIGTEM
ncbi:Uncharacterised protein [Mycobacteroides abscessus subsp. abscessus]|nr:Uncharacterised protein [Mycobacteroides abscessus subsp. abscessus]